MRNLFIGTITLFLSTIPTTLFAEDLSYPIQKFRTDAGNDYVIQKVWQTNTYDGVENHKFSYEPQSIAIKDDIIYVPQNYYISEDNFNLRRFNISDGTELETIPLKLNDTNLSTVEATDKFSDKYFYVVNDDAGNLIVIIDVVRARSTPDYPIYIGMIDTSDFSVPWLHKVLIRGSSTTSEWGYLGHPTVKGSYTSIFTDSEQREFADNTNSDFRIIVPISYVINSSKFESLYIAEITPDDIQAGVTTPSIFGFGNDLFNNGNGWENIYGSKRDFIGWLEANTFFYDTSSTHPFLSLDEPNIGIKLISDFDNNQIAPEAKGIETFNIGEHRFLVIGSSVGNRGEFILCTWDSDLPTSSAQPDSQFDQLLSPHATLGYDNSNSITSFAEESYFKANAQPWHLSKTIDAGYSGYNKTNDIIIYYPGSYLASYRIGTADIFTGIENIIIPSYDNNYSEDCYWTLTGIKLPEKPVEPGIYIQRCNGKTLKILIK